MSRYSSKRGRPIAFIMVEHEGGAIHLQDGQCQVMTKKDMLELMDGMLKFISNDISDEDIKKHNKIEMEKMYDDMDKNWRTTQPHLKSE